MFRAELQRVKQLYSELQERNSATHLFEERFQIVRLQYRLEDLLTGRHTPPGCYCYCFFVNARGIRHLLLSEARASLAEKIRGHQPMSLEEKAEALNLLKELSG